MNPVEFHPFEMQFEVPGTDGQTVYTRRFQAPRRLIILGCGYVAQSSCGTGNQQICVSSWILCYCGRRQTFLCQSLYDDKRKRSDL